MAKMLKRYDEFSTIRFIRQAEDIEKENKSFRSILNVILRCRVPIVFHNALIDIVFLYQSFICDLPKNFSTFVADLELIFKGFNFDISFIYKYKG